MGIPARQTIRASPKVPEIEMMVPAGDEATTILSIAGTSIRSSLGFSVQLERAPGGWGRGRSRSWSSRWGGMDRRILVEPSHRKN
jgi:hypothetical protein